MNVRTTCRGCESPELLRFLDLGTMPLAGGFLASREAAAREETYPLSASCCRRCGLVQITEVIDPEILFQDYSFASGTIQPLVRHFQEYARWLQDQLQPTSVVEFGCNDGVLLAPLEGLGIRATGVDVSRNISERARARGLDVVTGYFDASTAEALRERLGRVDVVTGSNAFAHNDRPERILEAARAILKPDGHLCLEVMYAGDLLEQWQWDTLYHEHLTFYALATLDHLLRRHGFHVVDAERVPMHGGSLRVAAAIDPAEPVRGRVEALEAFERERGLATPEVWSHFGAHVGRKIEIVREVFDRLASSRRIWAYGAAGKATLWLNACGMHYLEGVADASPLRAGKFMPGTHTPILLPEEFQKASPDYAFITAWNYADLIRSKETGFKGTWATPLPELRFF
jgi:novobiocin biosynthesis protein NovU/D-mycarose 3-C-methyltransferase